MDQLADTPAFRNEYAFLSNFYGVEVMMYGEVYPTVEHAFQAAKCEDPSQRERIRRAAQPGVAKSLGQKVKARADWREFRLQAMYLLIQRKFQVPELREKLLATGDKQLVERNYWKDTFWGVCDGKGENHLGRILMKVRDEIRQELKPSS